MHAHPCTSAAPRTGTYALREIRSSLPPCSPSTSAHVRAFTVHIGQRLDNTISGHEPGHDEDRLVAQRRSAGLLGRYLIVDRTGLGWLELRNLRALSRSSRPHRTGVAAVRLLRATACKDCAAVGNVGLQCAKLTAWRRLRRQAGRRIWRDDVRSGVDLLMPVTTTRTVRPSGICGSSIRERVAARSDGSRRAAPATGTSVDRADRGLDVVCAACQRSWNGPSGGGQLQTAPQRRGRRAAGPTRAGAGQHCPAGPRWEHRHGGGRRQPRGAVPRDRRAGS